MIIFQRQISIIYEGSTHLSTRAGLKWAFWPIFGQAVSNLRAILMGKIVPCSHEDIMNENQILLKILTKIIKE